MNIYIDESGSINNELNGAKRYFVICLICVTDMQKLKRAYKRFVSSNLDRLRELDKNDNKMFINGKFKELKGSQFDPSMKRKFIEFFMKKPYFDIIYIRIDNTKLTKNFCINKARCFNYTLRLAFEYLIKNNYLPNEEFHLQLDERNEKTEAKYFLENYLNTELTLGQSCNGPFEVTYYDSSDNKLIQIADVFSNWYYSQLVTSAYNNEFKTLINNNLIKYIFDFPLSN